MIFGRRWTGRAPWRWRRDTKEGGEARTCVSVPDRRNDGKAGSAAGTFPAYPHKNVKVRTRGTGRQPGVRPDREQASPTGTADRDKKCGLYREREEH